MQRRKAHFSTNDVGTTGYPYKKISRQVGRPGREGGKEEKEGRKIIYVHFTLYININSKQI